MGARGGRGGRIPQFYVCCICMAAVTGIIPALSHIQQDLLTLDRIRPSSQTRDPPLHLLRISGSSGSPGLSAFKLSYDPGKERYLLSFLDSSVFRLLINNVSFN